MSTYVHAMYVPPLCNAERHRGHHARLNRASPMETGDAGLIQGTQLQQVPPQRPTRARAWHACACVARRFSVVNHADPLRGCGRIRMIRRIGCEANGRTDVIQHQQAPADSAGDSCGAFDEQEPVPRTRGCSPRPLSCAEMDVLGAVRASVIHTRPDCLFAPQCRPVTIWGAVLRRCRDAV